MSLSFSKSFLQKTLKPEFISLISLLKIFDDNLFIIFLKNTLKKLSLNLKTLFPINRSQLNSSYFFKSLIRCSKS